MFELTTPVNGQPKPGRLAVGFIGAGQVGPVLASALRAVGHQVVGIAARSPQAQDRAQALVAGVAIGSVEEVVKDAELVFLTVNDDAIAPLVKQLAQAGAWRAGQLVVHTCGAYGTDILDLAAQAGAGVMAIHPAMTFTGTSLDLGRLRGCPWAVSAPNLLLPIAQALVVEMEGEPVVVADSLRPLYHAALAHGANHLVSLVSQAVRLLQAAGVADGARFMEPILQAALERSLREGESGLTGPVRRGDSVTVEKHLQELAKAARNRQNTCPDSDPAIPHDTLAEVPEAYRALAVATTRRLLERADLDNDQALRLLDVLS